MKKLLAVILTIFSFASLAFFVTPKAEAKSYIRSYSRSSGTRVRSYIRYKADGYRFNNFQFRPDRGYYR